MNATETSNEDISGLGRSKCVRRMLGPIDLDILRLNKFVSETFGLHLWTSMEYVQNFSSLPSVVYAQYLDRGVRR